jgi:hypothetical protein
MRRAFNLIELLIVTAGLRAGPLLAAVKTAQPTASYARGQCKLKQLALAVNRYLTSRNVLPKSAVAATRVVLSDPA